MISGTSKNSLNLDPINWLINGLINIGRGPMSFTEPTRGTPCALLSDILIDISRGNYKIHSPTHRKVVTFTIIKAMLDIHKPFYHTPRKKQNNHVSPILGFLTCKYKSALVSWFSVSWFQRNYQMSISCFLEDIDLISKLFKIWSDASSGSFGAHLREFWISTIWVFFIIIII